jgi:hypothetical protein
MVHSRDSTRKITIPTHVKDLKHLKRGTLRESLRSQGLTVAEFLALF